MTKKKLVLKKEVKTVLSFIGFAVLGIALGGDVWMVAMLSITETAIASNLF